jgi:hypothetical protein
VERNKSLVKNHRKFILLVDDVPLIHQQYKLSMIFGGLRRSLIGSKKCLLNFHAMQKDESSFIKFQKPSF